MNTSRMSLAQVVKSIACLTVTTLVIWPAVAGQANDLILRQSYNNALKCATAIQGYLADWNDTLPRMDNNGTCIYGQVPCDYPDWGDMRFPQNNPANLEAGKLVMFFGALLPYLPDHKIWEDPIGRTQWDQVALNYSTLGISTPPTGYNPDHAAFYDAAMPVAAVNFFTIDWGPQMSTPSGPYYSNTRPLAPRGRMAMFTHPESTILVSMASAWDWWRGAELRVGNEGVWPSYPDSRCYYANSDGWTRYSIPKNARQSPKDLVGSALQAWGSNPKRITENHYLLGKSMFLFADFHAEALTYPVSESCEPVPNGGTWQTTGSGSTRTMYYPLWVPEISP